MDETHVSNKVGSILVVDGSAGKESTCDAGDTGDAGLIPGSGRSPGGGNGKPTPVFLPGESHGPEEPGRLHSIGLQRVGQDSAQHSTKISTQLQLTPLHTPVLFEYDIHNFANPLMVLTTA